jgi:hypothetical protein
MTGLYHAIFMQFHPIAFFPSLINASFCLIKPYVKTYNHLLKQKQESRPLKSKKTPHHATLNHEELILAVIHQLFKYEDLLFINIDFGFNVA